MDTQWKKSRQTKIELGRRNSERTLGPHQEGNDRAHKLHLMALVIITDMIEEHAKKEVKMNR